MATQVHTPTPNARIRERFASGPKHYPFLAGGFTALTDDPVRVASLEQLVEILRVYEEHARQNSFPAVVDKYSIEVRFACEVSERPQPCDLGTAPSTTGPWVLHSCKTFDGSNALALEREWNAVQEFVLKATHHPYVLAEFYFRETVKTDRETTFTGMIPITIYYKRLHAGSSE
jgi:hypothetical protein